MTTETLAEELLRGARAIAGYTGLSVPQVYHLSEEHRLPTFKYYGQITARKSSLRKHFEQLEAEAEAVRTAAE